MTSSEEPGYITLYLRVQFPCERLADVGHAGEGILSTIEAAQSYGVVVHQSVESSGFIVSETSVPEETK